MTAPTWTPAAGPVVYRINVGEHCYASVHQDISLEDSMGIVESWTWTAGFANYHKSLTAQGNEQTREAAQAEALAWIARHSK